MRGQQVQAWKNTVGHGALWYKIVENWTGIGALGCADTLQKNWLADAGFDDAVIVETFGWRQKAVAYQYCTHFFPSQADSETWFIYTEVLYSHHGCIYLLKIKV